jgi:hypothetical protein
VSLLGHLALSMLMLIPASARCWSNVLGRAAPLSVNEALPPSMFFPEAKALPEFGTAALDEVLAVRVLVDHELDGPVIRNVATVPLHETQNRLFDLTQLLAHAVLHWQVKEQVAMHDIRSPA